MTAAILLVYLAQVEHQHHPPRSAEEYAKVLENPQRDAWQKPHEVIQALGIKPTDVSKVYAVDIDAKLLELAKGDRIETVLASADDPKLPPASVNMIFICDVLHHIDKRPAYYQKLAQALKPGGRIVIVDFYKKPLPVGPPPSMKLGEDQVTSELKAAGFRLARSHDFLPHQYFLEFTR
jgi:arsenite methyltransferase